MEGRRNEYYTIYKGIDGGGKGAMDDMGA